MTSRDFCYWLQGYFEIEGTGDKPVSLSEEQVNIVKKHLAMVFIHEIDPSFPKEQQAKLNQTHSPSKQTLYRC